MRSFLLWIITLVGCASWLPAPVPMRAVEHPKLGPRAACLMVFLPGRGDSAADFSKYGFVSDVQQSGYSIDMVATDATLGYYTRGIFSERLAKDVVLQQTRRGYKELWLVGNSMGGFGTMLYSRQRPAGEVNGVLALAPYLGSDDDLLASIRASGGLARWQAPPKAAVVTEHNYDKELWRWLQAVTATKERGPELYLGYGRDDSLSRVDSLLAAALPKQHVYVEGGGHNWVTWRKLFKRFLDDGPLRAHCQ